MEDHPTLRSIERHLGGEGVQAPAPGPGAPGAGPPGGLPTEGELAEMELLAGSAAAADLRGLPHVTRRLGRLYARDVPRLLALVRHLRGRG